MVGWQCRRVDTTKKDEKRKWPPKYFTMPGLPKTQIIVNYDYARLFKTVSIVEGWFDIFGGADGQGVATLGSSISTSQLDLLREGWGKDGTVVWCPDPDIYAKAENDAACANRFVATVTQLREAFAGRYVLVRLPDGMDVGDLHADVYREVVEAAAATQGVAAIDWGRR